MSGTRVRVCIVEDHTIVRAGLRMLIENHPEMVVVGQAASRSEALASAKTFPPDIFLLDLDLGSENGLDFLPELLSTFKFARVLILTSIADTEVHQRAMRAGAMGIVLKEHAPEDLVKAIEQVHSGEPWLGPLTASTITTPSLSNDRPKQPKDKTAALTPREREIVQLVAEGLNSERIAKELRISQATVKNHLTSILDKLGVANKFELAVYAFRNGLAKASSA